MKTIEQAVYVDVKVEMQGCDLCLFQDGFEDETEGIILDKQGAKQLIEVLKEFVNDPTRD